MPFSIPFPQPPFKEHFMNRFLKLSVIALGLAALPAFSQTNPATIATSIRIINPILFTPTATLNFGTVAPSSNGTANTFTITAPTSARAMSLAGNGSVVADGGNAPAVGAATMTSEGAYALNLAVSALTPGAAFLTLSNLTVSINGAAQVTFPVASFTPGAGSPVSTALTFGGDMTVNSGATPGTYPGSFVLTGTYN